MAKITLKQYSTEIFEGKTKEEIRDYVHDYYRAHLQGLTVQNKDKDIAIKINSIGRKKTARPMMNRQKAVVVLDLLYVLENAPFNNFGHPKPKHAANYQAVGFLNFRYKCFIDSKQRSFRVPIMITKDGKFQYDLHEDQP